MITFTELKDRDSTFDVAKAQCISKNDTVQILRNAKIIGQFNPPKGDWEEALVGPMKNSLAAILVETVVTALPNAGVAARFSKRGKAGLMQTMALLKGFEERGGKL